MRRFAYLVTIFVLFFTAIAMQSSSSAKLKAFYKGAPEELELARSLSYNYLEQRIANYGINSVSDLKEERVFVDELSMAHTRVQQTFQGVPVFGGEAIVHLNSDGSNFAFTDSLVKNVQVDAKPELGKAEAIEIAIGHYGCSDCLTAKP